MASSNAGGFSNVIPVRSRRENTKKGIRTKNLTKSLSVCVATLAIAATSITHASIYPGNGATGFLGQVGLGSLTLTDDGTTISGTITNGNTVVGFDEDLVLYIDSVSGGFSTTAGFNDTLDTLRKSISAFDGTNRETINLGIEADYAVFIGPVRGQFGAVFQLANGGPFQFITSAGLTPTGSVVGSSSTFTFSVPVTSIGLAANSGASFNFVATYLNGDFPFLSNETYGATTGLGNVNPGTNGTVTLSGFESYRIVPEPSTCALLTVGCAGLLALRRRK